MDKIDSKIKALRQGRNWTLKELSERTHLSAGFLSMIERGSTSLTVTSLKKIADAFEVNINHFFEDLQTNKKYHLTKKDQKAFRIEDSSTTYLRLGGNFPNRSLEPFVVFLEPNQKKDSSFSHLGEEFYYVLKGVVQFIIEDEQFRVCEGESIHFPSCLPHDYENPLNEESILLSVLTPTIF